MRGFTCFVGGAISCERTFARGLKRGTRQAVFELSPPHHRGYEMPDAWRADLLHRAVELDAQQLEHALYTGLAERAEAPNVRPADAYRARAHRQRLDDVGATAKP